MNSAHDSDIAPMLTALNIMTDDEHLPLTHIKHDRKWRKSYVYPPDAISHSNTFESSSLTLSLHNSQASPMGGRTIFEVLSCRVNSEAVPSQFVRININDGITAIPDCDKGPGKSCPLEDFAKRVQQTGEQVEDFREMCGLGPEVADHITFLHQ